MSESHADRFHHLLPETFVDPCVEVDFGSEGWNSVESFLLGVNVEGEGGCLKVVLHTETLSPVELVEAFEKLFHDEKFVL